MIIYALFVPSRIDINNKYHLYIREQNSELFPWENKKNEK